MRRVDLPKENLITFTGRGIMKGLPPNEDQLEEWMSITVQCTEL
jgi:hypothetical protein